MNKCRWKRAFKKSFLKKRMNSLCFIDKHLLTDQSELSQCWAVKSQRNVPCGPDFTKDVSTDRTFEKHQIRVQDIIFLYLNGLCKKKFCPTRPLKWIKKNSNLKLFRVTAEKVLALILALEITISIDSHYKRIIYQNLEHF